MAYIINDAINKGGMDNAFVIAGEVIPTSPLAHADFWRQVDIYKLAKMGNPQSRRLWNDFANECPHDAQLVLSYIEKAQREKKAGRAKADKVIDGAYFKARPEKAKKPKKRAKVGKDLSAREAQHWRRETVRADLFRLRNSRDALMAAALDSPDPAERETARRVLNEG